MRRFFVIQISNMENNEGKQNGNGEETSGTQSQQNGENKETQQQQSETTENKNYVEPVNSGKTVVVGVRVKEGDEERFRKLLDMFKPKADAITALLNVYYENVNKTKPSEKKIEKTMLTDRTNELLTEFEIKLGSDEFVTAMNTGLALYMREKDPQKFRLFMVKQKQKQ